LKAKIVVSARDFVLNVIYNKEPDGSIYCVASSSGVKVNVPEMKGVVRAEAPLNGVLF